MKKSNSFFKRSEAPEGHITWNCIEIEKLGGSRVDINGSEYNITPELTQVFTKTKGSLVQKLSNED